MESALRALQKGNVKIGVLQEKKMTGGIHTRYSLGYRVWVTEAEIPHRGGITTVW